MNAIKQVVLKYLLDFGVAQVYKDAIGYISNNAVYKQFNQKFSYDPDQTITPVTAILFNHLKTYLWHPKLQQMDVICGGVEMIDLVQPENYLMTTNVLKNMLNRYHMFGQPLQGKSLTVSFMNILLLCYAKQSLTTPVKTELLDLALLLLNAEVKIGTLQDWEEMTSSLALLKNEHELHLKQYYQPGSNFQVNKIFTITPANKTHSI